MSSCRPGVAGDEWTEMREVQLWGPAIYRGRVEMKDRGLDNLVKDWVKYAALMLMGLVWESTIVLGAEYM
jgi:hypothetical protein